MFRSGVSWLVCLLALAVAVSGPVSGQPAPGTPAFKQEELNQLVAPIALYPDALLAQVLMASTYPLEIVQADRWSKQNPKVTGKALEDAMQKQTWDPSVKSLAALPDVLTMMSDKLDWTQKLGDAFLAQQKDVMDTVQALRKKADQAGNLKSGKEQTVTTAQEEGKTVIIVQPANPQVVYVPTYNPTVVYGPWPYPAYPPYYYYPPAYPPGAGLFWFATGVAVGAALWGNCNWGRGNVNINVNNYNSYNRTNISNNNWNHNVEHRKGVAYRDQGTAQKYNRGASTRDVQSREEFRGRAEQGRQELQRGNGAGAAARPASAGVADRAGAASGGNRGGFDGIDRGAQTREASQRGNASRQSMAASRPSGGASARPAGGARPSAGAARAGGGRGR